MLGLKERGKWNTLNTSRSSFQGANLKSSSVILGRLHHQPNLSLPISTMKLGMPSAYGRLQGNETSVLKCPQGPGAAANSVEGFGFFPIQGGLPGSVKSRPLKQLRQEGTVVI